MAMEMHDLENRFNYHRPNDAKVMLHEQARETMLEAARTFDHICPDGREKALAITKLEEAMFWANAAIARHQ